MYDFEISYKYANFCMNKAVFSSSEMVLISHPQNKSDYTFVHNLMNFKGLAKLNEINVTTQQTSNILYYLLNSNFFIIDISLDLCNRVAQKL